jgi:hypothetical protein
MLAAWRNGQRNHQSSRLSLRAISAELAARGVLNERGRPFNPKSVATMLTGYSRASRRLA